MRRPAAIHRWRIVYQYFRQDAALFGNCPQRKPVAALSSLWGKSSGRNSSASCQNASIARPDEPWRSRARRLPGCASHIRWRATGGRHNQ
jgi:hypothetical protein